jgi:glyoxylase I family protein
MTTPPLGSYHHIGLTVRDPEASAEWYQRVLGFEHAFREEHGDGYALVMHRPGSPLFLGLDRHVGNEGEAFAEQRTGLDHLAIHVAERADLDAWVAHLDAEGVKRGELTDHTEPFPFSLVSFRDPDNIQLELIWQ